MVMSDALPIVYLARHGETAWTISRQHTGLTDLPLTAQGEAEAARLGQRLEGLTLAAVLTASLSAMGYEHDRSDPVIRFWDEMPDERRVSPAPAHRRRGKVRR
jgi:bisphosphoglycerate-dependent phosphoglycerate mutase